MRRIRVKAIHNRLDQVIRWPTTDGGTIEVPPKADLAGAWLSEYDEAEHSELGDGAEENEVCFTRLAGRIPLGVGYIRLRTGTDLRSRFT